MCAYAHTCACVSRTRTGTESISIFVSEIRSSSNPAANYSMSCTTKCQGTCISFPTASTYICVGNPITMDKTEWNTMGDYY